ncbi:reverse transcriptase [Corchorus capsularis]|uniref:Reverse transcriptase n=1 Tax=Corchorus capsularis TaxID=210143 RepID=A0A1R3JMC3_COCAP|nr:reverse transcriptase [Corchorus capsularis]
MPPPKERRPSIPVRYGYINRAAPSRQQVSQPMAPRPVALGSMPRRKLYLTTTEDMPMKVSNRSFAWRTVQRKLDFAAEDVKPSMIITSAVQGTSKPMLTRSKITASAPHVLKPTVQFPTRSRSEIRPWLERRKKEIRTMAIQNEVKIRRDHAMESNRPKMVRPTVRAPVGVWQKVEHPKFPTPPIERNKKTWRRREFMRRAKARKELQDAAMEEEVTALRAKLLLEQARLDQRIAVEQAKLDKREALIREKEASLNEKIALLQKKEADGQDKTNNESPLYSCGSKNKGEESENDTLQANDFLEDEPLPVGNVEEIIHLPQKDDEDSGGKVEQPKDNVFIKPDQRVTYHIKPLYIKVHLDGVPMNRVLVDNGATVNLLPYASLKRLGRGDDDLIESNVTVSDFSGAITETRGIFATNLTVGSRTTISAFFVVDSSSSYNALLGRDWIHSNWCVPSSLHQLLSFWNGNELEVVHADRRPFKVESNVVEVRYYGETIGTTRFLGQDKYGRPIPMPMVSTSQDLKDGLKRAMEDLVRPSAIISYRPLEEKASLIANAAHKGNEITMEELDHAPMKLDDLKVEVQDSLLEIDLGTDGQHRPTYISQCLCDEDKIRMVALLKEYKDCFAWDYPEMLGLSRDLVEHRLPIIPGYRPYQQPPRRMANDKTGKIGVCVDFRNLNLATAKDEYPMPVVDLLVDRTTQHKILSFMDGHSGYNQIYIAEEDVQKTAFRCPGVIGTFEWVVMSFGLKNAGATYQRAMNAIFHDMIGKFMEVYINDVVVKSHNSLDHIDHLKQSFDRMRRHDLKMNPLKCAFGVTAGNFLGFLVHQRGIEVDQNKTRAIMQAQPPANKKELQRFLGQVNFLRRFISNTAGKTKAFSPLLRLNKEEDFIWTKEHQDAFEAIKNYLAKPPVLVPPWKDKPLYLYVSATTSSIGCLLAQEVERGKEHAVYYLSRALTNVETRYSSIEKLCLSLYFATIKLRNYMLYFSVCIIAKTDIVKYMLTRPILRGRLGKWCLALSEFGFRYIPQQVVKGQAVDDFLADHPCLDLGKDFEDAAEVLEIALVPWVLEFDGSSTSESAGVGIIISSPQGTWMMMAFHLDFECMNNQAKYEALIIGLEMLREMKASSVQIKGDSLLVVNHLTGEFKCTSPTLLPYFALATQLLEEFDNVSVEHVPRHMNEGANVAAQLASGITFRDEIMRKVVNVVKKKRTRSLAIHYTVLADELYRKGVDGVFLRCLDGEEAKAVVKDKHGPVQRVPSEDLHSIVKPWPFRGWAINLVGKIYPPAKGGVCFIIIATDYFTKCVQAKAMNNTKHTDIQKFIEEHIIYRFVIPETLTSDQGLNFDGEITKALGKKYGIKCMKSTPHYAQANGQAEASNKVILKIMDKLVLKHPGKWDEYISRALWAYRMSQRSSTGVSPFNLTYGHDAMVPMEILAKSARVAFQNDLTWEEYTESMMVALEDKDSERLSALDHLNAQKRKAERSYNKKEAIQVPEPEFDQVIEEEVDESMADVVVQGVSSSSLDDVVGSFDYWRVEDLMKSEP